MLAHCGPQQCYLRHHTYLIIIVMLLPLPLPLRLLRSCSSQVARPQRSSLARKVWQTAAHCFEFLDH
jgi:hypothetical protein